MTMQLIHIDKTRYRRHLNYVIIACILSLSIGSVAISQSLIALFPAESGSHFHWNLLGVVISSMLIAWLLNHYRSHDFMTEVTYIWQLKQALNKINRKIGPLKTASQTGNINALIILQFSYAGSRLLWQLDDNTILMDELAKDQAELDKLAKKFNLNPKAEDYDERLLKQF